jgi:hypothetical protein
MFGAGFWPVESLLPTMSDRETRLRELADELRSHDRIASAFLAKSFTDRVLIVDVAGDGSVPESVASRLADAGLSGDECAESSFRGAVGDATRHHFVDTRTRGRHQSYVVE